MTTTYEPTATLWACIDCTMIEVNGEPNPEWSEQECDDHVDAMFDALAGIDHVSLGMLNDAPECSCDDDDENQPDEWHLEVCERTEFSRSPCDLCGSRLGGSRDAFTGWIAVAPDAGI